MKSLLKEAGPQSTRGLKDDVELQPHQKDALEHAEGKPGTLLHHGTGSGKTVTALAAAEQKGGNTLAVTPASLTQNYDKEVEKFVKPERQDAHQSVSYAKFRKDPDQYLDEHDPDSLVFDEIHRLRNPTQAREAAQYARDKVDHAVGLTATPTHNHPKDIAQQVNLVAGDKVISQDEIEQEHIDRAKESPGVMGWLRGAEAGETKSIKNKDQLKEKLGPYVHRHEPDSEHFPDVEKEEVEVPMSSKQEDMIKQLEKNNPALAHKMKHNLPPSKQEASNLNAFLQGTRQIANTPATHDQSVDDPVEASPKMQRVLDDLKEDAEGDDDFRGAVFSNYLGAGAKPIIDKTKEDEDAPEGGLYEGSLSRSKRKELLNQFEEGDKQVLGLSPAGSEGLDLKGVRTMSVLEPDWNPRTTEQAVGRAARYKSHEHLPEDKQKVNIRRYKSVHPEKWHHKIPGVDKPTSPDEYLESIEQEKSELNQEFEDAIHQGGS
ncbi:MAG: helicase-related protein [Bradymonadaceae bacterium]